MADGAWTRLLCGYASIARPWPAIMLVTVTGECRVGEYGGGETPRKCADVCTGGERGRCGER